MGIKEKIEEKKKHDSRSLSQTRINATSKQKPHDFIVRMHYEAPLHIRPAEHTFPASSVKSK